MMSNMSQYAVNIDETHHLQKIDKPSGTAKQLAEIIIDNLDRKKSWALDKTSDNDELLIVAHRQAEVPGTHHVIYQSNEDEIQISHTAKNREGFARGAMMAALWLAGKKGFFSMDDFIGDLL
jgi:4-hydroxy-tetrahydrodipicolinate reductase